MIAAYILVQTLEQTLTDQNIQTIQDSSFTPSNTATKASKDKTGTTFSVKAFLSLTALGRNEQLKA